MTTLSRRDFLKLSAFALGNMAFAPIKERLNLFDDRMLVRVATDAISVHSQPNDEARITGQWYRDDLLTVYEEVTAETPAYNPVWYRVWGGFVHRARLQRVQLLQNHIQTNLEEGERYLAEVTVPYTRAMRYTKFYGWEPLYRLYYESVHWIDSISEGPDGKLWYRIFDELASVPYFVQPTHLRMIPPASLAPISPEVDFLDKRVEVDLSTQKLTAYEYEEKVFQTIISSGLNQGNPNGIGLNTPTGTFNVREKMPSKHMGNGSLASDISAYELPGVPWTSFFTEAGHAFHGTYWHENYGVPMSHGCINMRTSEAKWLFRWLRPVHDGPQLYRRGYGTTINIFYS
ncbi:MAG: L,D-transpeptidase [Anaerolineae bacterium]|jgi:hypothetical protein|nr:L,D-transpeptidase [Anaerolineae bacterium]MBT7072671.1 L,D-transpeptidase [Anaerolineae bacterium]MBT7326852.1 L,D-transpeptidase [Anaerolineae bacterium]